MADSALLQRCLRQAARRLWADRFLAALPWCLLAASMIGAMVVVVSRYRSFGITVSAMLCGVLACAVAAALIAAWWRRGDALGAAVELDRRCGLDERASSAVALMEDSSLDSPVAQSLLADTERVLADVDVAAAFPLAVSRRWYRPLVPALAAIGFALWFAPSGPTLPGAVAAVAAAAQVKESTAQLEKKLTEKKQRAEELKLVEAQKLLEKLQEETHRLQTDGKLDRKEALIRLNDLAKQLEDRRRAVANTQELQQQLSRLRTKESGPAEKLAQALGRGDFRRASEQLQRLREQTKAGGLDDKQKQELEKQLDELQKQVDETAQRQQQRQEAAAKQLAQGLQKKESNDAGAPSPEEMSALSDKLAAAGAENDSLQRLKKSLEDAAEGMKQGRSDAAQQALDNLQNQLEDLAAQNDERQLLEGGLQDLADAKAEMGQGDGPGNQAADAAGGRPGGPNGREAGGHGDRPGRGGLQPGVGTARNENPTTEDPARLFDSRVRTSVGAGPLHVVGPSDGPNAKGRALEAIREQAQALADGAEPQPVANQPLDRSRRAQKREYFDALRKGE